MHVCYPCVLSMYALHVCHACMLCMYVMHVCYACVQYYACVLYIIKRVHRPFMSPSPKPFKNKSFPGIHSGLACQRCPQSDPSDAQSQNNSSKTVEIHCLFARRRGFSISKLANASIVLLCPLRRNPLKTSHFPGIIPGLACQRCPQSDPSRE